MAVAVLFGEQEVRNKSIASFQARTRQVRFTPSCRRIAAAQRPAVQEESDLSAKRSGAAMYAACFSRRGATKPQIERAMQGHVLANAELIGTYQKGDH
jgi:hypothetical protein